MRSLKVVYRDYSRGTKGWKSVAPRSVPERQAIMDKCGKDCFMRPEYQGFPVCPKGKCAVDCRGVLSAYNRASQFHYSDVRRKSRGLARRLGCRWSLRR